MISQQCSCGKSADVIRYKDGKKVCNRCEPLKKSGTFLRRLEGEAREYDRDIIQKYHKDGSLNPDFIELYGKGKNA